MVRLPIPTLFVALAIAAAGCGGGGSAPEGTPPADWAATVCGALGSWQTALEQQAEGLGAEVLQAATPQQSKERIVEFLDSVVASTETMRGEISDVGRPAVEAGADIEEDLRVGLEAMQAAFQDAQASVAEVPTDDPQAFQQELTRIGEELQQQGQAIGDTLGEIDEKYDAPELSTALEETDACQEFTN
ncbi:MAG: hypothetical protein WD689_05805 [Gaiellaceae bacterium]